MKVYIASGWFNDLQMADVQYVEGLLDGLKIAYFSPRLHNLCPPTASEIEKRKAFDLNLKAIEKADLILVNTRDKDMGTIFEAGYAYAKKKPILYYCKGLVGGFNLMLALSGNAVATSESQLEDSLKLAKIALKNLKKKSMVIE